MTLTIITILAFWAFFGGQLLPSLDNWPKMKTKQKVLMTIIIGPLLWVGGTLYLIYRHILRPIWDRIP